MRSEGSQLVRCEASLRPHEQRHSGRQLSLPAQKPSQRGEQWDRLWESWCEGLG